MLSLRKLRVYLFGFGYHVWRYATQSCAYYYVPAPNLRDGV